MQNNKLYIQNTALVQCPNENDVCISDLRLDWTTRGQIVTHIIRGCKEPELVNQECTSGASSLVHFKDCTESCTTPGCNSELDGVAHKFVESSITRGVNECNTCFFLCRPYFFLVKYPSYPLTKFFFFLCLFLSRVEQTVCVKI